MFLSRLVEWELLYFKIKSLSKISLLLFGPVVNVVKQFLKEIKSSSKLRNKKDLVDTCFLNGPSPASFSVIFVFSNKYYNFHSK